MLMIITIITAKITEPANVLRALFVLPYEIAQLLLTETVNIAGRNGPYKILNSLRLRLVS